MLTTLCFSCTQYNRRLMSSYLTPAYPDILGQPATFDVLESIEALSPTCWDCSVGCDPVPSGATGWTAQVHGERLDRCSQSIRACIYRYIYIYNPLWKRDEHTYIHVIYTDKDAYAYLCQALLLLGQLQSVVSSSALSRWASASLAASSSRLLRSSSAWAWHIHQYNRQVFF